MYHKAILIIWVVKPLAVLTRMRLDDTPAVQRKRPFLRYRSHGTCFIPLPVALTDKPEAKEDWRLSG